MTHPDGQGEPAAQDEAAAVAFRARQVELERIEDVHVQLQELENRRTEVRRNFRGRTMELFKNNARGNAGRFAMVNVDDFRLDAPPGAAPTFWVRGPDNRWRDDFGASAIRAADAILDDMQARAEYLIENGDDDEVNTGGALRTYVDRVGQTRTGIAEMARLGCELHGMMVNGDEQFDARRDLLACQDTAVILSIQPGTPPLTCRPLEPDDMVTKTTRSKFNFAWASQPPPPEVKEYFSTFIPDESRARLIQKVLGSCIIGGNTNRLAIFLMGKTTTGKSQLAEVIDECLGDYSLTGMASIFRGNMDDKPRPDIMRLMRARVAIVSEASESWSVHADRIKDLTGGGKIAARNMRQKTFADAVPQFTPIVVTNEMPGIPGADEALMRRMLVIRFDRQPENEDPSVKQRFLASHDVREWFLFWLLQGFAMAQREGLDDAIDAFAMDTVEAFATLDHVGEFIESMEDDGTLLRDPEAALSTCVGVKELHRMYKQWVLDHGNRNDRLEQLGMADFGKRLEQRGWRKGAQRSNGTRWEGWRNQMFVPEGFDVPREGGVRQ